MKNVCVSLDDRTAKAYDIWLIENGLKKQKHLETYIKEVCGMAERFAFWVVWGTDSLEDVCEELGITVEEAERYETITLPLQREKGVTIYKNYDGLLDEQDKKDIFSDLQGYLELDEIDSVINACIRRGLMNESTLKEKILAAWYEQDFSKTVDELLAAADVWKNGSIDGCLVWDTEKDELSVVKESASTRTPSFIYLFRLSGNDKPDADEESLYLDLKELDIEDKFLKKID